MISQNEVWVDVVGYEKYYQVSSFGRVRSLPRTITTKHGETRSYKGYILKPGYHPAGYPKVNLHRCGEIECVFVHRLVCIAFHGERTSPYEVAHENGDPKDCSKDNIRWSLPVDNNHDKRAHGTHLYGEKHPGARLKETEVVEIKKLLRKCVTHLEISKMYNVHEKTITSISTRQSWSHI